MATLNLSDQSALKNIIAPKIQDLKTAMDSRKVIWDKISPDKKKKWVVSGKDPIMTLAWSIYRYLRDNFFDERVDNDDL